MSSTSWLRKLFPGRKSSSATPCRRRTTRLGFETLDDRCMPSATATLDPGGTLHITSDTQNSEIDISSFTGPVVVASNYRSLGQYPASAVKQIIIQSDADKNNYLNVYNWTNINTDYYSGNGGGVMQGGSGIDNFYGQKDSVASFIGGDNQNNFFDEADAFCDYFAGTGNNVLYRASEWTYVQTYQGITPGPIETIGLKSNPYSDPAALNDLYATGGITAYLTKDGKDMVIEGPTGGGFELSGTWHDTLTPSTGGDFVHNFTSSSTVGLVTGIVTNGKPFTIPLPNAGVKVVTQANDVSNPVGIYNGIQLSSGMPITTDSTATSNSPFSGLLSGTGLSFTGANMSWGIRLGSDPVLSSLGMPLLANVPYLYATASTITSANFGSQTSVSTSGYGGAVVIDPADPAVYLQFTDSSLGTFSGGISLHGAIPYTPTNLPDGVNDPGIYGNLYLSAAGIALGDLPIAVSGSVVLGLDANHDGAMLNLIEQTPSAIKTLLSGSTGTANQSETNSQANLTQLEALAKQSTAAMNDIQVGVNGSVAATTEQYGISLNINAATGSLFYTPNADGSRTVAFDVSTVDPFAGTVLDKFAPKYSAEIGGFIQTHTSGSGVAAWGFEASAGSSTFAGFSSNSITIAASSATMTATVNVGMHGMMGMENLSLNGSVDLKTGNFDLTETAGFNVNAGVGTITLTETFDFGYHSGVFTAGASIYGYLQIGSNSDNVHMSVSGNVNFTASSGSVTISGGASVYGGLTVAGKAANVYFLGFDFNNDGFDFTALGKHVHVSW